MEYTTSAIVLHVFQIVRNENCSEQTWVITTRLRPYRAWLLLTYLLSSWVFIMLVPQRDNFFSLVVSRDYKFELLYFPESKILMILILWKKMFYFRYIHVIACLAHVNECYVNEWIYQSRDSVNNIIRSKSVIDTQRINSIFK